MSPGALPYPTPTPPMRMGPISALRGTAQAACGLARGVCAAPALLWRWPASGPLCAAAGTCRQVHTPAWHQRQAACAPGRTCSCVHRLATLLHGCRVLFSVLYNVGRNSGCSIWVSGSAGGMHLRTGWVRGNASLCRQASSFFAASFQQGWQTTRAAAGLLGVYWRTVLCLRSKACMARMYLRAPGTMCQKGCPLPSTG